MPVKLDDGCIYADIKGSNGKITRVKLLDLVTTSTKRGGRKSLILTDDGAAWIEQEIGKGAQIDDLACEMCVGITTLYTPANREKTKQAVEKGEGWSITASAARNSRLRSTATQRCSFGSERTASDRRTVRKAPATTFLPTSPRPSPRPLAQHRRRTPTDGRNDDRRRGPQAF